MVGTSLLSRPVSHCDLPQILLQALGSSTYIIMMPMNVTAQTKHSYVAYLSKYSGPLVLRCVRGFVDEHSVSQVAGKPAR